MGSCVLAPNLVGWRDVVVGPRVADALGLPAVPRGDTDVAIMGRVASAPRSERADAIYLTVSTGIGGAVIIDGSPLIGTSTGTGR